MMWSALVLGFMGSVHCLAMCGPLVLAINARRTQTTGDKFFYNTGRIFTYCLLGVLAGVFGSGLQWFMGQQFLSVFTGILLVVILLISWFSSRKPTAAVSRLLSVFKSKLAQMLDKHPKSMWWFGVYNGFLPCGLTYVALAAAVATGNVIQAVIYMALFGLGTSPMMWAIVSSAKRFRIKSLSANAMVTGFTWFLALLLIIRGMGLGIPYLSPDQHHQHHTHMSQSK